MREEYFETNGPLSKGQKVGFILLLIFGISMVFLGFMQMRNTIRDPFRSKAIGTKVNSEAASTLSLQDEDTDRDGLNNFDELQVYGTSPYLPDTDSDGISDSEEIKKGTDPNCPEGTNCGAETTGTAVDVKALQPSLLVPGQDLTKLFDTLLSGTADVGLLRSQLQQSGVKKEVLDGINDEQLLSLYQETIGQQLGTSTPASAQGNTQVTPELLRKQLLQAGMDPKLLEKIGDEELFEVFTQTLQEEEKKKSP